MALPRPVVLVYQEYATLSTVPTTPELNVLIAGPAYHIQDFPDDKGNIRLMNGATPRLYGTYEQAATGSSVAPLAGATALEITEPPNFPSGAVLDAQSVKVYFSKARAEILHDSAAVSAANSPDVTLSTAATGVEAGDRAILTKPGTAGGGAVAASLIVEGQSTLPETGDARNPVDGRLIYTAKVAGVDGNAITIEHAFSGSTNPANGVAVEVTGSAIRVLINRDAWGNPASPYAVKTFLDAQPAVSALVSVDTDGAANGVVDDTFGPTPLAGGDDGDVAIPGKTITRTVSEIEGNKVTFTDEVDAVGYTHVRIERVFPDSKIPDSFVAVAGNSITIKGGVTIDDLPISSAEVYVAYRALRTDLQDVTSLNDYNSLRALFGRTLSASATDTRFHSGIDARNPLAVGAAIALLNTNTSVQVFGIGEDSAAGYSAMLSAISNRKDVYAVVPLTRDVTVVAEMKNEFDNLASTEYALTNGVPQKFRVVIGSAGELPSYGIVTDLATDGQVVEVTAPDLETVHTLKITAATPTLSLVDLGVLPGASITLGSDAPLTVARVNAAGELEVSDSGLVAGSITGTVMIEDAGGTEIYSGTATVEKAVDAALHLEFYDADATFIDDGVLAKHYLELPLDPRLQTFDATTKFEIASVVSNQRLRIKNSGRDTSLVANELPHGYTRIAGTDGKLISVPTTATLAYRVVKSLDKDGQVSELISVAQSIKSRRAILCWPDKVDVAGLTDGSLPRSSATPDTPSAAGSQPGYYLACAVGGMTAGLPSHQGFTNLGIAGISKIYNANTYFTDRQITQISSNGWFVFQQDTPSALPYVVHQLTTDPSTLQFGEFSLVKNFDFVSMFFSDILDDYLGIWNMNKDTFGYIETALRAGIENLKLKRRVRIGAPIIDARITKLGESELSEDRLEVFIEADFPKPLNTVGLHIVSA